MPLKAASPPVVRTPQPSRSRSLGASPEAQNIPGSPTRAEEDDWERALTGFVRSDDPADNQENVYVVLGHGSFQWRVLFCAIFAGCVVVMNTLAPQLVGRPVDHWCRPPKGLQHLPPAEWKNMAIPLQADGSYSKCSVYDPLVEDGTRKRQPVPCNEWDYDVESVEETTISKYGLVCQDAWLDHLSFPVYVMGAVLVTPAIGVLLDHLGRKPTIVASAWVLFCACLFCGVSQTFALLFAARFVVSATAYACFLLLFILLYEVTGRERRTRLTLVNTALRITLMPRVLDVIRLADPGWKVMKLLFVLPCLALALFCSRLEESPTWLLSTWKMHRAEKVILAASARNGVNQDWAELTFRLLKLQMKKREDASMTVATLEGGAAVGLAFTGGRALSVALTWFYLQLSFYGFHLPPETTNGVFWAVTHMLLQGLLYCSIGWFMHIRGAIDALSMCLVLCGVLTLFLAATTYDGRVTASSLLTLLLKCVSSVGFSVNYSYMAEVFPTGIRSIGMCCAFIIGKFGTLSAGLLTSTKKPLTLFILHLTMAALALLCSLANQWLPVVMVSKKPEEVARVLSVSLMSEEQRKEMIKASLSLGCTKKDSKRREQKSRREKRHCWSPGSGAASLSRAQSPTSDIPKRSPHAAQTPEFALDNL
ncbi:beta-alanine transporter-like [Haemaphysalis longicornis]